jgi:hypothetical protein
MLVFTSHLAGLAARTGASIEIKGELFSHLGISPLGP